MMMTSQLCSLIKHSAPWIGAVAVLVTFASFFFYILLFLFSASLLLILSTSVVFTLSKQGKFVVNQTLKNHEGLVSTDQTMSTKSVQECQEEENVDQKGHGIEPHQLLCARRDNEKILPEKEVHGILRSSDLHSESDIIDDLFSTSTEHSDLDLPDNYSRSQEMTDGSISDEESLIEIALPSGHFVSTPGFKLPTLMSAEAMFKQHGLMELLAEFNEENLIEIDISMGSIICPRFEIKA